MGGLLTMQRPPLPGCWTRFRKTLLQSTSPFVLNKRLLASPLKVCYFGELKTVTDIWDLQPLDLSLCGYQCMVMWQQFTLCSRFYQIRFAFPLLVYCFAFQEFLRGMGGSISLVHHFKVTLKDQPVFLANSSFGSLFAYILFKTFTFMFIMKVISSWHVLSAVRAPEISCVIFCLYLLFGRVWI